MSIYRLSYRIRSAFLLPLVLLPHHFVCWSSVTKIFFPNHCSIIRYKSKINKQTIRIMPQFFYWKLLVKTTRLYGITPAYATDLESSQTKLWSYFTWHHVTWTASQCKSDIREDSARSCQTVIHHCATTEWHTTAEMKQLWCLPPLLKDKSETSIYPKNKIQVNVSSTVRSRPNKSTLFFMAPH